MCVVGPTDCHHNATCLDRDGGYDCECDGGYSGNGTYCEGMLVKTTLHLQMMRAFFADIDECSSGNNTCHVNATCSNTDGSYDCECLPGFMGDGFNCSSKLRNVFRS